MAEPVTPDTANDGFAARLAQRMEARDMTKHGLARAIGRDPTYVGKVLKGIIREPSAAVVQRIADALETTTDWLLTGKGDVDAKPAARDSRPAAVELPLRHEMPADVKVLGTVAGSHTRGAFSFEGGVIDYVRRPPGLRAAANAYALYVEGTSMDPAYPQGELVFVHPDRPARFGDPVVVQVQLSAKDGIEGTLGYYASRTAEHVVLRKLNPASEVKLKRNTVVAVHKVLTMTELFGV